MASVLVCGGGNAAQVVSCLFASRYKVTAISLYADEAERWDKAVKEAKGMTCNFQGTNKAVNSMPDLITKDPSAVKNCDVVLFTVPSSFHEQYFRALEPFVQKGTIFAVMPARSGCDFLFKKAGLRELRIASLASLASLPPSLPPSLSPSLPLSLPPSLPLSLSPSLSLSLSLSLR